MTGTMILLVSFKWSHLLNVSDKTLQIGLVSFNEAAIVETKTNTGVGDGNVPEIWKLSEKKSRDGRVTGTTYIFLFGLRKGLELVEKCNLIFLKGNTDIIILALLLETN